MYIQHILDTDGGTSRCWAGSFAAKPCNVITVIVEIMPIEISRCLFLAISLSLSLSVYVFVYLCMPYQYGRSFGTESPRSPFLALGTKVWGW